MSNKRRLNGFSFVRSFCALSIILNHFSYESKSELLQKYFYRFPNGRGSFGYSIVTVFFIVSGALLYYNYEDMHNLKGYYSKRWKAIFPSYYLTYFSVLIAMAFFRRSFFNGKHIINLVFTLIGMDGYLSKCIDTWYLIGEWFIGPIVILYLIYPILLKLLRRYEILTVFTIWGLYLLTLNYRMFDQNPFRSLFSCLVSFLIGILIMKHNVLKCMKLLFVPCLVCLFACCLMPVIFEENISSHIIGICMFIVLLMIGNHIETYNIIAKPIKFVASVSYEIFLIQHIVIWFITGLFVPTITLHFGTMLVAVYIITILAGYILNRTNLFITRKVTALK